MQRALRFEIANTKGSRHSEQKSRAKMHGLYRKRVIRVADQPIRPGRSLYMDAEELLLKQKAIREAEEAGAIVIRHDRIPINIDAALALIEGKEIHPPFTTISNVMDPAPADKADGSLIRLLRPKLPAGYGQELTTDEETPEVAAPAEEIAAPAPHVDLSGLDIVLEASKHEQPGPDEPRAVETEEEVDEGEEYYTVRNAASYLGKSQSWIRKRVKDGTLKPQVIGGVQQMPLSQLLPLATE